jgi:Putative zinc-finger
MNCRHVDERLSHHLEGLLSPREARAVDTHLEGCSACRRRQEQLRSLGPDLRVLAALRTPPDLFHRAVERWSKQASGRETAGQALRLPPSGTRRAGGSWVSRRASIGLAGIGLAAAAGIAALLLRGPVRAVRPPATKMAVHRVPGANGAFQSPATAPSPPGDGSRRPSLASPDGANGGAREHPRQDPALPPRLARVPGHAEPAAAQPHPRRGSGPWRQTLVPDDLRTLNGNPSWEPGPRPPVPLKTWQAIVGRVRDRLQVGDDFVQVPFPRLASTSERQIAQAVESYKHEVAIVDARLARDVTVQQKATALSDLCERLRGDSGIRLEAGQSVADEKVIVLCSKVPLRDVMRQLGRPFGYTWLRSGKEGDYRYELVQDLRSQLMEEELRNRDRAAALLALEREIERYRPYLALSPDEALARSKTAPPTEKPRLENLASTGWGPIHMYFRLSHSDMEALRAGHELFFSQEQQLQNLQLGQRPLPSDLTRGVLQSVRGWRLIKSDSGFTGTVDLTDPRGLSLTTVPEVRAQMNLKLIQSEMGQSMLLGASGFFTPRGLPQIEDMMTSPTGAYAVGMSPAALKPENATTNAQFAHDPELRPRISILCQPTCRPAPDPTASPENAPAPKVTAADVLEAIHRASSMPIVADYYTRLYKPEDVSTHNRPLFDALNQLADAMRLSWNKDGAWLQFRSVSYYDDRLKEVPNRLLTRWATARRQHGALSLDELIEIAQLPDAQLDATGMAEGARDCYGLVEWDLARNRTLRPHLRYLTGFTSAQRQEAMSDAGLPFTKMSLAQQQGFLAYALIPQQPGLSSLDELTGATLRVEYTQPGWFQSGDPLGSSYVGGSNYLQWVVPIEPGPQGRRVLRPRVRERTREAALQTVRRIDPQIREALRQAAQRADPRAAQAPIDEATEIFPTRLNLAFLYVPGTANWRCIRTVRPNGQLSWGEDQ